MTAPVELIRRERAKDVAFIHQIHLAAFAPMAPAGETPPEAGLVGALRASDDWLPSLSLVATRDDIVVGHVVCSRAWVGERPVVGLGPIGVLPGLQGKGIGHALMHAVVASADALDEPLVGLLGSTEFYARFGFRPSRELEIEAPDPAWGDHFQVRPLSAYSNDLAGRFRYARGFEGLDEIGPFPDPVDLGSGELPSEILAGLRADERRPDQRSLR
jgi:putative acetyltransferase